MQIIKGGFSFVEFDSSSSFTAPKRIDQLLKAGTSLVPKTITEDFADGKPRAAAKAIDMSVRSANVDDSASSFYAALKTAEEARTAQYFRFVKVLGDSIVIHTCDAAWQESVAANTVSVTDADFKKEGASSSIITFSGAVSGGTILATVAVVKNLTTVKVVKAWFKSVNARAAGDLQLLLDNSANCASPLETLPLPALPADTWVEVELVLKDPSALGSVISIGLKTTVALGVSDVINIDDVRGCTGIVLQLTGIIPRANFEHNEAGKHNAIRVSGEGFADAESGLLTANF